MMPMSCSIGISPRVTIGAAKMTAIRRSIARMSKDNFWKGENNYREDNKK